MNLTRAEARERAELITVESYDVSLDLTRGGEVFGSTTTVKFSAKAGSSTFIDAVTRAVHSVTLNGRSLDPATVADGVRIQLPGLEEHNELTVVADAPYMNTGEGLHRFVDPVDNEVYLYTQFEVPDSRRMFAVFEQPDLKAAFAFTVTAPSHWDVISNSPTPPPVAAAPGDDGGARSVWSFSPTPRLSSYVTALIAGPYQSVRSEVTSSDGRVIPLGVFARKSLMQYLDADNIFELTRQGFGFFEAQFGCPYPFEKYDQLFVPEFNAGAMENAGAVTILEGYVFRSKVPDAQVERRAITVLHELAHMWFGDLVTMRWWNDLWLNESFAEYMSHLAAVEATSFTSAWTTFASVEKSWAYRQDQLPTTHPIFADINDLQDVEVNFDGITYAKGASVLRQLVAWVGPEQFMAGVREYFAKHSWQNTELNDLLVELEKASGRDLDIWGRQWLETAGVNALKPELEVDADGRLASFAILQSAVEEWPTIRPHRLAVGFYNLNGAGKLERVHREELDVDGERTEVPGLVGLARPDLVLVNDDDLAYAKVRLDEKSLATATAHLKDFSQSLPRTLVWNSAWDAARDGETPARRYVELILANVAAESDSSVILVQLRQLATTLNFYVAEEHREQTAVAAADRLWELASDVPGGSDAQLQFVKSFALLARSGSQLDRVAGLLDGSLTLEGLAVDQDLRWELVASLVAGGRLGQAEIDAELQRDNTSSGQNAAALAKAAIPTPEAKAAAWEAIVVKGELSNALQGSAVTGFMRVLDRTLIEPYAEKYFQAVPGIVETRTHALAQQIVVGLYPALLTTQATIDRTDGFLASLPPQSAALRRMMLENRDGVARALRARAADVLPGDARQAL
ncbi:aminopeptidase N [Pseudarthrobacter phenanthrenivorans]|uniref:Aminopeptidase N n=1 Tax=Pseudarthrobacter phenanthrenivorans (strain DSM 18606 / JCM 16027 / LMG 23796 / Sphe3) TaxID=930171 RepID=F0M4D6_PSEPM|nr:aminopeptidase N [Pseudarthrobacter phenanthrenivorans]ADX73426.1 Membrane alanyl aminopeptidase [Pseudarthrobacter phenanthrenivorans Sphe3]TPV53073.1 aminopeptidase N [Pseudarthrobacter phenanthrenivorans]